MPSFIMTYKVDGGCRGNGLPGSFGAAAAIPILRGNRTAWRKNWTYWELLRDEYPYPTNQRAELRAMILALEAAMDRYAALKGAPFLHLTIKSDSWYAVNCLSSWVHFWRRNGWVNQDGCEVANRDLIEEAFELSVEIQKVGKVVFRQIPRKANSTADRFCRQIMNGMAQHGLGF